MTNRKPSDGRTTDQRPPEGDGVAIRNGNVGSFEDLVTNNPEPGQCDFNSAKNQES